MILKEWKRRRTVESSTVVRKNLGELIATTIACWIQKRTSIDELEYLKIKLGIEVIIINLVKGIIVYGISFVLNIFYLTLVLHSSYLFIRSKSHGLHATRSLNCTIISVLLFVLLPYTLKGIIFSNSFIFFIFVISFCCLNKYAPADTDKQPLIGRNKREKLRKQSLIRCLILFLITLGIQNSLIKLMITLGVMFQIIFILPVTYKLLKRSYNNYEKYEEEFNE